MVKAMRFVAVGSILLAANVVHAFTPAPIFPVPMPAHEDPQCVAVMDKARELAEEHRREQRNIERTCESMADCDRRIREWRSMPRSEEEIDVILKALECAMTAEAFPVEFTLHLLRTVSRGVQDDRVSKMLHRLSEIVNSELERSDISRLKGVIIYAMGFNGTQADRERLVQFTSPEYWEEWFDSRDIPYRRDEEVSSGVRIAINAIGQLPVAQALEALQEVERQFSRRDRSTPPPGYGKPEAAIERWLATMRKDVKLREAGEPPEMSLHREFWYLPEE